MSGIQIVRLIMWPNHLRTRKKVSEKSYVRISDGFCAYSTTEYWTFEFPNHLATRHFQVRIWKAKKRVIGQKPFQTRTLSPVFKCYSKTGLKYHKKCQVFKWVCIQKPDWKVWFSAWLPKTAPVNDQTYCNHLNTGHVQLSDHHVIKLWTENWTLNQTLCQHPEI